MAWGVLQGPITVMPGASFRAGISWSDGGDHGVQFVMGHPLEGGPGEIAATQLIKRRDYAIEVIGDDGNIQGSGQTSISYDTVFTNTGNNPVTFELEGGGVV